MTGATGMRIGRMQNGGYEIRIRVVSEPDRAAPVYGLENVE
jgi:hypothetical protein